MAKFRFRRYRIALENRSTLQKTWSIQISSWRLWLTLAVCALVFAGIGALIVALTPVKRSVPGFMTGSDRTATLSAITRIDSIAALLKANQAYIDNLTALLDENRLPADSSSAATRLAPLPLESLRTASERERKFVASIDDRERYNLNVLSPLAAESMIFSPPADGGIVDAGSARSRLLKLIVPAGQGVNAIMDGRVIERTFDSADASYTLLIQGNRGFLVRYTHLAVPLAEAGESVTAGQRLSVHEGRKKTRTLYVGIEMWREGTPLVPGDYLYRTERQQPEPIEAPRGK